MSDHRKLSREDKIELSFLQGVHRRRPDDVHVLSALGELFTRGGRFDEGLEVDRRLCDLDAANPVAWYNLACSQALTGHADEALATLSHALDLGYSDAAWMATDQDLASLRDRPEFTRLLDRIRMNGGTFSGN